MLQGIFPRVFDTIGHLREMTGGPMRIKLKPTPWCHPTVFVPKKSAAGPDAGNAETYIRVCVDFTQLNAHVRGGVHPNR